jgi:hypothetical protein
MLAPVREDTITIPDPEPPDNRTRVLLLAFRQALLIALGALEDYLCIERTRQPKHRGME